MIVLASRRQLAVEEKAMALAFSRVAVLERERCFLISYAEHRANVTVQFQCIFRRSVPCGTAKRLQRCAEDGRNTEERSQLERRRRNWRLFTPGFAAKGPEQNDIDNPVAYTLMRRSASFANLGVLELLPGGSPGGTLLYRTGRQANKT